MNSFRLHFKSDVISSNTNEIPIEYLNNLIIKPQPDSDIQFRTGTVSDILKELTYYQNVRITNITGYFGLNGTIAFLYKGSWINFPYRVTYSILFPYNHSFTNTINQTTFDCDTDCRDFGCVYYNSVYTDKINTSFSFDYTGILNSFLQPPTDPFFPTYEVSWSVSFPGSSDLLEPITVYGCRGNTFSTNLQFSFQLEVIASFYCDSTFLENPLCLQVTECNQDKPDNCDKYFNLYEDYCRNNLTSDYCFNFVQNYYNIKGNNSNIDNLLRTYCANQDGSSIFNQNAINNKTRNLLLCGCHMPDSYYTNFHNSIKQILNEKGFKINESTFSGQKEICFFPPCTIASSVFPSLNLGKQKCNNQLCLNIQTYSIDGKVKNNQNITINEDSTCVVKQDKKTIGITEIIKEDNSFQDQTSIIDIIVLLVVLLLLIAFTLILRFSKKF